LKTKDLKLTKLKDTFAKLRKKGVLSITDIVLNQIAIDSKWLVKNSNAAYNLKNSPHLHSAWLLDQSLSDFSQEFANGNIEELEFAPKIQTEKNLKTLMKYMESNVIEPLKIDEFF
jgi:beta-lactamase class D